MAVSCFFFAASSLVFLRWRHRLLFTATVGEVCKDRSMVEGGLARRWVEEFVVYWDNTGVTRGCCTDGKVRRCRFRREIRGALEAGEEVTSWAAERAKRKPGLSV